MKAQIAALVTRLDNVEATADQASAGVTNLQNQKANKNDSVDSDDVRYVVIEIAEQSTGSALDSFQHLCRTIVAAMIANQPASNALAASLNSKLDATQAYDDTDVASVVATIVTAEGNTNALRTKLNGLTSQLNEVIANQAFDCGATCAAGEYVQTSCNPSASQARNCAACGTGTFSLGGLLDACVDCATACPVEHHRVADCTATRDIACSKCTHCVSGATYETAPCTTETDRTCATCATCADDEYMVAACNASSNTMCAKCELCAGPNQEFRSCCTSIRNAVCMATTYSVGTDMAGSRSQSAINSWRSITTWRQTPPSTYSSHFLLGPVMPTAAGFTTVADGYHFVAANVRMDDFTSGNAVLRLERGSTLNDQDGTNAVLSSANFRYRTFTVSAIVKVRRLSTTDQSTWIRLNHVRTACSLQLESWWLFQAVRLLMAAGPFTTIAA